MSDVKLIARLAHTDHMVDSTASFRYYEYSLFRNFLKEISRITLYLSMHVSINNLSQISKIYCKKIKRFAFLLQIVILNI